MIDNCSKLVTISNSYRYMWVSRFKYMIKVAPGRFELGATPCPTHVGGHLDQLWNSNRSYLSISLRVQDTFLKWAGLKKRDFIVSIAFLRLKNTIATKKEFGCLEETRPYLRKPPPQENPVFKPAHPHIQGGGEKKDGGKRRRFV